VSDTIFGPSAASTSSVILESIGSELVVNESGKGDRVTEELQRCDGVVEDEHRGNNEENVLEDTTERKDERRGSANLRVLLVVVFSASTIWIIYQKHDRNVEAESDHGVEQEGEVTDTVKVGPGHAGGLDQ
jgi:hypothetical protein